MLERKVSVEFTCDVRRCGQCVATCFSQREGFPERVVDIPVGWFELREAHGRLRHFCSAACLGVALGPLPAAPRLWDGELVAITPDGELVSASPPEVPE